MSSLPGGAVPAYAGLIRGLGRAVKRRLVRRSAPLSQAPAQRWSIGIYTGVTPLSLQPSGAARNPVLTGRDVRDAAAAYVADPFMLRRSGRWHMFFEVMDRAARRGAIGHATSGDGARWTYEQVVLREPFHLSYPFVLEWNGDVFMLPETYMTRSVHLYRATAFPTEWSCEATLLEGDEYCDPTPLWHEGRWWLYVGAGTPPLRADVLRLFHAPQLTGPWVEHPASPLIERDPRTARPAGRVLAYNGRVVRLAQDCYPRYGSAVRAFEVTSLTTTHYAERELPASPVLGRGAGGWNTGGMHHLDLHRLDTGGWIAGVDGWAPDAAPEAVG